MVLGVQAPAALQVLLTTALPAHMAVPQSVPAALARQPEPSALQVPVRQGPLQLPAEQQRPPRQVRPLWQSDVAVQASPGPLSGGGGVTQAAPMQRWPAAHLLLLAWHAPALQALVERVTPSLHAL